MRFKEKQYLKKTQGKCPEDIKAMFRDEVSFKRELVYRKSRHAGAGGLEAAAPYIFANV